MSGVHLCSRAGLRAAVTAGSRHLLLLLLRDQEQQGADLLHAAALDHLRSRRQNKHRATPMPVQGIIFARSVLPVVCMRTLITTARTVVIWL